MGIERQPRLAEVATPLLLHRCRVLKKGVGGAPQMMKVVTSRPELLLEDAEHTLEVLPAVFGERQSQSIVAQFPELLTRGVQIEALFARLKEQFPNVYVEP